MPNSRTNGAQCQSEVHEGFEVTLRGAPHPFEAIVMRGGSMYARLLRLEGRSITSPPLPLRTGQHDFEPNLDRGETWMRLDGGVASLVALELQGRERIGTTAVVFPREPFAWEYPPPAPAARLLALTDEQAQTLASLRVRADAFEVPDLSRFERLSAVELLFTRPVAGCSADEVQEVSSREPSGYPALSCYLTAILDLDPTAGTREQFQRELTEHTPRWIRGAKAWLQALPEGVEVLRLEDVPFEALEVLPHGIEHLELVDVYGSGSELSLADVPGMRSVRTLVVAGAGRLSLAGLEQLRQLTLRGTWIDLADRGRLPQLEKLESDSMNALTVEHAPLEELRSALDCATRIFVRQYHHNCGWQHGRPAGVIEVSSPIPVLAVVRSLLVDARDGASHPGSCDLPALDVYRGGAYVLTISASNDCRTLLSESWHGGVTLTDTAARRLCTMFGRG